MQMDTSVVVVGAGLAGLVAAWDLTRAGIDCQVLEASDRIGGRVESLTYPDGVVAEAHLEELWSSSPAYPLLHELGLELDEDVAHSSVVLGGRLFPYRGDGDRDDYLGGLFDPEERDAFLRWDEHARRVLARVDPEPRDVSDEPWARELLATSFATYVRHRVRSPRVADWVRVVVESETAVEWDSLSALDGLAELRPFLDSADGFGELNAHVVGGNARFTEAIAARLPEGTVRTGQPVTSIRAGATSVAVEHGRGAAHRSVVCDQLVLATPPWSWGGVALDVPFEPAALAGLETLAVGSYVKVLLRLRPEAVALWQPYGDGLFTLLTDSPAGCVYAGTDPGGRAPRLTQLVHAQHARDLAALPPQEIGRRAVAALDRLSAPDPLWPGLGDLVTDVRAFAYPQAVAAWPVTRGRSRYDAPSAALRRPQGRVHLAGDAWESTHSDGAVRSGRRVAARLVALLSGSGTDAAQVAS